MSMAMNFPNRKFGNPKYIDPEVFLRIICNLCNFCTLLYFMMAIKMSDHTNKIHCLPFLPIFGFQVKPS